MRMDRATLSLAQALWGIQRTTYPAKWSLAGEQVNLNTSWLCKVGQLVSHRYFWVQRKYFGYG